MGQVAVKLNGKTYHLRCGDGEEQRLAVLAAHVNDRIEALAAEFGQVGDERLMLMAALLTADELLDTRDRLVDLEHDLEMVTEPGVETSADQGKPVLDTGRKAGAG